MAAGIYNFVLEQGATFTRTITWRIGDTLVDLSGYAARLKLKHRLGGTVLENPTTENGKIVLGGAAGTIIITLSAAETALLEPAGAVYDLELIAPSGFVTRLLRGDVLIDGEVTD